MALKEENIPIQTQFKPMAQTTAQTARVQAKTFSHFTSEELEFYVRRAALCFYTIFSCFFLTNKRTSTKNKKNIFSNVILHFFFFFILFIFLNVHQAEDEHISIIPNFNSDVLHFLNGDFGPFHSDLATDVPLWLALALKDRGKCRIESPLWLSSDILKSTLEEEKRSDEFSKNLPFHYVEISHILFNHASDNIEDVDRIRTLIEDISGARATKIREGSTNLMKSTQDRDITGAMMTGVSHMEINNIRRV
jgi:GINS complex subunit 2